MWLTRLQYTSIQARSAPFNSRSRLVVDLSAVRLAADGNPLVEAHQLAHPAVKGLHLDTTIKTAMTQKNHTRTLEKEEEEAEEEEEEEEEIQYQ